MVSAIRTSILAALAVGMTARAFAQAADLPKWELVRDVPGKVRVKVTNTLDRSITAVMVRDTVTNGSSNQPVRFGFSIMDSTYGPTYSLKPGETFVTPFAFGDWSADPRTGAPGGPFKHEFALVAVATDAPDVRGDAGFALVIKQRRKALYDVLTAYVGLMDRYKTAQVAADDLVADFEGLSTSLVAKASNNEEKESCAREAKNIEEGLRSFQKQTGKNVLTPADISFLRKPYETRRAKVAEGLIP